LISNRFGNSVGGPEKAGVGGSIPSLATIPFNNLATAKNACKNFSREQYANIGYFRFHFWRRSFERLATYCSFYECNA